MTHKQRGMAGEGGACSQRCTIQVPRFTHAANACMASTAGLRRLPVMAASALPVRLSAALTTSVPRNACGRPPLPGHCTAATLWYRKRPITHAFARAASQLQCWQPCNADSSFLRCWIGRRARARLVDVLLRWHQAQPDHQVVLSAHRRRLRPPAVGRTAGPARRQRAAHEQSCCPCLTPALCAYGRG